MFKLVRQFKFFRKKKSLLSQTVMPWCFNRKYTQLVKWISLRILCLTCASTNTAVPYKHEMKTAGFGDSCGSNSFTVAALTSCTPNFVQNSYNLVQTLWTVHNDSKDDVDMTVWQDYKDNCMTVMMVSWGGTVQCNRTDGANYVSSLWVLSQYNVAYDILALY